MSHRRVSEEIQTFNRTSFCVSYIPRPHPKPTRKDKKKERGKSRQKTAGAIGAVYVKQ